MSICDRLEVSDVSETFGFIEWEEVTDGINVSEDYDAKFRLSKDKDNIIV